MRWSRCSSIIGSAVVLQACSPTARSPSIPIFGSYFPAWVLCAVAGILIALVLRVVFIALHIDEHLPAAPLVYLCLSISAGIGCWMYWTGLV